MKLSIKVFSAAIILCAVLAVAQVENIATPDHVASVRRAQKKSAYAIASASNGCPTPDSDMDGWPSQLIRKCIYSQGSGKDRLEAVVYLLDIRPEIIATWIETTCATQMRNSQTCFDTILKCGRLNSGMMFPISGNLVENSKNYFFRNGMTVSFGVGINGSTDQIPLDRQDAIAEKPDDAIRWIPSGLTRFWRTLPSQFAARFPSEGAPTALTTQEARQRWLKLVRTEILSALGSDTNRLLDSWVAAHLTTIRQGNCPEDDSP